MDRIRELIDRIKELNYHYYTLDNPLIPDSEYDLLYDELVKLENETGIVYDDSPTQTVGDKVLEKFVKHEHLGRLYSLSKAQDFGDIREWIDRIEKIRTAYNLENEEKLPEIEYTVELKFDGLTINLTYENGKLVNAATRGTGVIGEEILLQVRTIKSIPLEIDYKGLMEVSGEGVMPLSALEKYNLENEVKLKNARNAAAGALRNLDPKITGKRNLEAYFYNVGYMNPEVLGTQIDAINFLKNNQFNVFPFLRTANNLDEIIKIIKYIDSYRKDIDVLTDGVVIKVNDFKTRDILGYTNKSPRWALAYKFEAEKYTTTVKEVIWNVGRTGKITPVAILEPVDIEGVTVSRATLNNYDDIERKNVKIGSTVIIRRSNDVIPEILMALEDDSEVCEIEKPTHCPSCNTELFYDRVHIYCPNSMDCLPQMNARITHFASREAMNIEGLSEKTIEKLISELNITRIDQLYDLTRDDLFKLDGFKDKKTDNILKAIDKSKKVKLDAFIYALGIPNVGIKTASDLANKFKNLESIKNANLDQLLKVEDIGEITAKAIVEFFNSEHIELALSKLLSKGIEFEKIDEDISDKLKDLVIVVTGTIDGYNRKEIEKQLKLRGATVTSSVSKNTDILLAGEKAGSKLEKAVNFGVKVYQGSELEKFLLENIKQEG
ncbi:MAG: NAD-dependent DNA ligase LigA [Tissierellia bacterium]|nr:NAD-dependent DNA ligase LigA [Tissierellia bacterium]